MRIRQQPVPGTATVDDVERIRQNEGFLCELIEGVLVQKTVGLRESCLAVFVGARLNAVVIPRNRGIVTGADGAVQLAAGLVRIPDVAFTSWDRMAAGVVPEEPIPHLVPNLAGEILSNGNTPAEMALKRQDYFGAGVDLVWEIDPEQRTVDAYTSPTGSVMLGITDVLDGGTVLPGFRLPLAELFGELDRRG